MKTNFNDWLNYYRPLLVEHYRDFEKIFEGEQEVPCFLEFAAHCFRNTTQTYNSKKMRYEAKIYRNH